MKYALLFFSFFLVFVLNSEDASSQVQQNSNNYCVAYASSKVGKGNPRWGSEYESCLKQMGQRATQSGQYVQKYHFDNPQYKKCLKDNDGFGKASEKTIDACMARSSVKQQEKENEPQASSDSKTLAEKCKDKDGIWGQGGDITCACPKGKVPSSINPDGDESCKDPLQASESPSKDNNCSLKKPNYGWAGNDCICGGPDADYYEVVGGECKKKVAGSSPKEDTPSCLQDFKAKVNACKSNGKDAVEKCNKDNKDSNAQWSAAQSVIGPMAQIMQMRGQQQGSAETCFQAGALATTTWGAMDLLKESCEQEIEVCQFKCNEAEEAYKEIEKKCEIEAVGKPEGYLAKMKQEADKLNADLEKGAAACEKDAKTNQARIIDMMNGMNKSAQQAAKCQCQMTAGQTNCDQILGPADCKLTPKDPRCPQAVTVKCAGTDYNTKECICLRDPKAVSCIGTTGSGASQVAGFNPVGAGSTNFKMGGTGSGGGLGDFPSDAAAAVSMDKTQGGVDSPFSAAGGGGGGGSSGGGGSDGGSAEGGAAEPEAKTGIAGLFNNLKTGVAGLFGGSGAKKPTADGKNFSGKSGASKNIDPNQWRPVGLRGIAGGNGIGSKNSDIFKTVNNQYNNQYHTLMTLPAEGPK